MSKEDELVNVLVQSANNHMVDEVEIEPEAHYNNYGTRGVADLHVREIEHLRHGPRFTDNVYEVKSREAVVNATGANEIIRQFNKMRGNFYEDQNRREPYKASFELTFEVDVATVLHVAENIDMYAAAKQSSPYKHKNGGRDWIMFRRADLEKMTPARVTSLSNDKVQSVRDWAHTLSVMSDDKSIDAAPADVLEILEDHYDLGLGPGR